MPFNLNTVMIAGNLTRNPELRVVGPERTVAGFSLAINRRYKGADGELKDEVTFVDCEAWGRTAELVGQYLVKGSGCFIEGRLKLDAWTDKEGKNRSRLKVVADLVQFVGRRPDGNGEAAAEGDDHDAEPRSADTRPGATMHRPRQNAPAPRASTRIPAGTTASALQDDQPPF
jgi:single-strand DNA-binding protein